MLQLAFQASPTATVVVDGRLAIVAANPAYEALTGRRALELLGSVPAVQGAGGDGARGIEQMAREMAREPGRAREVLLGHRDGRPRRAWMSWACVADADGAAGLHVATFTDLGLLDGEREIWRHRARHDTLTGLPNRHHLDEELARSLARAARHGQRLAVLFVDIDGFKSVNDGLGHDAGDRLLVDLGRRLREALRAEDLVARLGGDEFVAVLEAPRHAGDAAAAAGALLCAVGDSAAPEACAAELTASIGIALFPDDGADAGKLLSAADAAMYRAKRAGGNTFAFCNAAPVVVQRPSPVAA